MSTLTTIDLNQLAGVHGGETSKSNFNIGATVPLETGPAQIGVQGSNESTNYKICTAPYQAGIRKATTRAANDPSPENLGAVSTLSNAMVGACGLPPSGAGQ